MNGECQHTRQGTAFRMLLIATLLGAPVYARAGELDDAAAGLLSDLVLPTVETFSLKDDLAVVVQLEGELSRVLGGLLLARLTEIGAKSPFLIERGPDADRRAREAGAEWLLSVGGRSEEDRLSLFAELRRVDHGIWVAPPRPESAMIVATAEHRSALSQIPEPRDPPPPGDVAAEVRFEGPALRIASLAERVLAVRACRLTGASEEELLVLSLDALTVYSLRGGRLRRLARHELAGLPRHRTPARDPVGAVSCQGARIALGHSGLAKGQLLTAGVVKKQLQLSKAGELSGIPLAALPDGGWLLAETVGGTSRYAPLSAGSPAPILDAVALDRDAPEGWRLLAVTADYQLVRLGEDLAPAEKLGPSGVGISAFLLGGKPHVVATATTRDGGRDALSLYGTGGPAQPMPVDGLVFATAVGRLRGPALDLVMAVQAAARSQQSERGRERERTDLYLLRVGEPK